MKYIIPKLVILLLLSSGFVGVSNLPEEVNTVNDSEILLISPHKEDRGVNEISEIWIFVYFQQTKAQFYKQLSLSVYREFLWAKIR
ncbi:MAG: hypothetical protein JSW06_01655 [Thermoplasmatales archaeon]|nr:MAG: hypothetical protein JSW06_01655 [Thermoplasmatales archaeon]